MTLPIVGATIIFQEARLTAWHSPTHAIATYQLFIRHLPTPSHDCPHSFATWKQTVWPGKRRSIHWMQKRPSCVVRLWNLCHFCIYSHLSASVLTSLWFTHRCVVNCYYEARPGNSNILSQIIDISYHKCKFGIIVECFLFINFKCTFMHFSTQASMEIDMYRN
jgi:hypothetical protein